MSLLRLATPAIAAAGAAPATRQQHDTGASKPHLDLPLATHRGLAWLRIATMEHAMNLVHSFEPVSIDAGTARAHTFT